VQFVSFMVYLLVGRVSRLQVQVWLLVHCKGIGDLLSVIGGGTFVTLLG